FTSTQNIVIIRNFSVMLAAPQPAQIMRIQSNDFSFNHSSPTEVYTLSLHDALPILTVRIDTLPIVCFHASKSWRLFYGSFLLPFERQAGYFAVSGFGADYACSRALSVFFPFHSPNVGFHNEID